MTWPDGMRGAIKSAASAKGALRFEMICDSGQFLASSPPLTPLPASAYSDGPCTGHKEQLRQHKQEPPVQHGNLRADYRNSYNSFSVHDKAVGSRNSDLERRPRSAQGPRGTLQGRPRIARRTPNGGQGHPKDNYLRHSRIIYGIHQ